MQRRALAVSIGLLFVAAPAFAQKAKSVEKEGDLEVVTLESGAIAKVYKPKDLRPAEKPGLVVALHGTSMRPDDMLTSGRRLADHRGDVWVACRGGTDIGGGFGWNPKGDVKDVAEMARYAVGAYGCDGKRVVILGFSGGAMIALDVASAGRGAYAGVIACSGPRLAWRGAAIGGMRAVAFLGEKDDQFPLSAEYRTCVLGNHPATCFWVMKDTGHQPPADVYLNDALNFVFDPAEKPSEKNLPASPDHGLAEPKGRPAPLPEFTQIYVAWKSEAAPGVSRDKAAAKATAEELLAKLRKKELTVEAAVAQSDDAGTKAKGGATTAEALQRFGPKVLEKAAAMKPETWELVEGATGYHLLLRPKNPAR